MHCIAKSDGEGVLVMKECFGTIYPDLTKFQFGKELVGKVFSLRIDTIGPFQRDRELNCDTEEWAQCQRCDDFKSCIDFSTGKLLMQRFLIEV
jgi:hypothetical protein